MSRPGKPLLRSVSRTESQLTFRRIHGYRRAVRVCGDGPPLLLIHGIGDNSETWLDVIPRLATKYTVIAPDLLGHGASDKPRADYSVGGYANGMRDLLSVLGYERVTVIGHSLGGGVAAQLAYQFPELVERLILVCPAGAGPEVHPLLRLASAPVLGSALVALQLPGVGPFLDGLRLQLKTFYETTGFTTATILHDAVDVLRVLADQAESGGQQAFQRVLRAAADWRGQAITFLDRSYLLQGVPVQIIWGRNDRIIPSKHARLAHAAIPGSRLDMFDDSGHFPFRDDPARFVRVVDEFLETTRPADYDQQRWRQNLTRGFAPSSISGSHTSRMAVLDAMVAGERSAT